MRQYTNQEILEVREALGRFIDRESGHPCDRSFLLRFLEHELPMNASVEEVHESIPDQLKRIKLIHDAESALREEYGDSFTLKHIHQVMILLLGGGLLQSHVISGNSRALKKILNHAEPLLARFLQTDTDSPLPPDVVPLSDDLDLPDETRPKYRSKTQRKKAQIRDNNRCLITGAIDPDVCHIVPFIFNDTIEHRKDTLAILSGILPYMMPADDIANITMLLWPRGQLAASDKLFNLLCLAPHAHRYWSRGYFALKWVGAELPEPHATDTTVQLQFQWSVKSLAKALDNALHKVPGKYAKKGDAFRPVDIGAMTSQQMSDVLDDCLDGSSITSSTHPRYSSPTDAKPLLRHDYSGLPIKSGHIVKVTSVPTEDVPKMKLMIELQDICIRLASMSGAAEAVDYLDPRPPPEPIMEWDSQGNMVFYDSDSLSEFPISDDDSDDEKEEEGGEPLPFV
ncbi:unnamed protein product [Clonostachys rosea]|uniref:HNH nuclease domain-containing protein n=1 Tax=Bionectria ochroleuca TaxID=29856 RepID=A0ABY6UPS3_BIOOC|nr:unnamed protein product [Clonostachys rosea]